MRWFGGGWRCYRAMLTSPDMLGLPKGGFGFIDMQLFFDTITEVWGRIYSMSAECLDWFKEGVIYLSLQSAPSPLNPIHSICDKITQGRPYSSSSHKVFTAIRQSTHL